MARNLDRANKSLGSDFGACDEQAAENSDAIHLIRELYRRGAIQVTAIGINDFLESAQYQTTDKLIIELPNDEEKRKKLFARVSNFYKKRGYGKTPDVGQKFLLVHWN